MPVNKASIDWTKVKNKPSTLSGFGITDALANGQTWQNVTGSRALSTTYYNTTGKPILVAINTGPATAPSITFTVNGTALPTFGFGSGIIANSAASVLVPAGQSYSVAATGLGSWYELR